MLNYIVVVQNKVGQAEKEYPLFCLNRGGGETQFSEALVGGHNLGNRFCIFSLSLLVLALSYLPDPPLKQLTQCVSSVMKTAQGWSVLFWLSV